MSRKIVAVLICLAMVALVGTAVAQQKEPAKQPPQAQPQAQPQPPVAGVQPLTRHYNE